MHSQFQSIKLVAIGDSSVGKTSLLVTYTTGNFPDEYSPTVFDNYSTATMLDQQPVFLILIDLPGLPGLQYEHLRAINYPDTDVFLLLFSVTSEESLEHIRTTWKQEIEPHLKETKENKKSTCILLGTKCDLRPLKEAKSKSSSYRFVSQEKARSVAEEIRASLYMECSALTQENLQTVFDQAIAIALKNKPVSAEKPVSVSCCCSIL